MCGLFSKGPKRYLVITDSRLREACSSAAKTMGLKLITEDSIEKCQMKSVLFISSTLDSFADVKERISEVYRNRYVIRHIIFWPRHPFSSEIMQTEIERMDRFLIFDSGSVAPFLVSNDVCKWETALRFSDRLNTSTCDIKGVPYNGDLFIIFYEEEHLC